MSVRIRVAKAMGCNLVYRSDERDIVFQWRDKPHTDNFDPENDANDDYAVLEWMRDTWAQDQQDAWLSANFKLGKDDFLRYRIGDYARSALKVLQ